MEVSVEEIKKFFAILERNLRYTKQQFNDDCLAETNKLKADYHAKTFDNPIDRFAADSAHKEALKKVPDVVRHRGGIRFIWAGASKKKVLNALFTLYLKFRVVPDTPENDAPLFMVLMLESVLGLSTSQRMAPEETLRKNLDESAVKSADSLPLFLGYIRNLFKNRWHDHLCLAEPGEVLDLSLLDDSWGAIAQGFVGLVRISTEYELISLDKCKALVPTYLQKHPNGTETHNPDFFELLFPGLNYYFQQAVNSFRAGTGLFWIPRRTDVEEDGETLKPIRLFTETEKKLLTAKYGDALEARRSEEVRKEALTAQELHHVGREDKEVYSVMRTRSYAKYFTTKNYIGPAITQDTYDKLRQHVEEALLVEYQISEDTHAAEITAWIAQKEAAEGPMRSADDQRQLTFEEKRFVALRTLQDEALEAYTAQFLIDYNEMNGWFEGLEPQIRAEAQERLKQQVLCLEGIYTDSQVINYTTFENLMYLLSPTNRAATTCAHTIWGRLLFLLCDYDPNTGFDARIEALFDDYLEIARERSRNRKFAQLKLELVNSSDCEQGAEVETTSEGSTTDEDSEDLNRGLLRVVSYYGVSSASSEETYTNGCGYSPLRDSPIRAHMRAERERTQSQQDLEQHDVVHTTAPSSFA
ncbi:MAG: hypothetical protein P1U32_07195 [Legionellaceae bacterium]|nr:hypothetical protein [Legionellaceae bacterium]